MPNSPLTNTRIPDTTYNTDIADIVHKAIYDLEGRSVPRFTTTSARDSAYSAWVAAGGTLSNGSTCYTDDSGFWDRLNGAWVKRTSGDTGWINITPNAPFTVSGSSACRYRVINGIGYLSATITRSTAWTGPLTLFTLPAAASPPSVWYLHAINELSGSSAATVVAVKVNGTGAVDYRYDGSANDVIGFSGSYPVN